MKKPYLVEVSETYSKHIVIYAESLDDAARKAEQYYAYGELDPADDGNYEWDCNPLYGASSEDLECFDIYDE